MGFLDKYQPAPPLTNTAPVKDQTTSIPPNLEKSHLRGNEVDSTIQSHQHHALSDTERKVVRKIDLRVVPLVTALYVLSFLDRSNIGKYVAFEPCLLSLRLNIKSAMISPSLYSQNGFQGSIYHLRWAVLTTEIEI